MKVSKEEITIISGCKSELLDTLQQCTNTEASGDGIVLLDVEALVGSSNLRPISAAAVWTILETLSDHGSDHGLKGLIILRR
jgi:hypothetical protein